MARSKTILIGLLFLVFSCASNKDIGLSFYADSLELRDSSLVANQDSSLAVDTLTEFILTEKMYHDSTFIYFMEKLAQKDNTNQKLGAIYLDSSSESQVIRRDTVFTFKNENDSTPPNNPLTLKDSLVIEEFIISITNSQTTIIDSSLSAETMKVDSLSLYPGNVNPIENFKNETPLDSLISETYSIDSSQVQGDSLNFELADTTFNSNDGMPNNKVTAALPVKSIDSSASITYNEIHNHYYSEAPNFDATNNLFKDLQTQLDTLKRQLALLTKTAPESVKEETQLKTFLKTKEFKTELFFSLGSLVPIVSEQVKDSLLSFPVKYKFITVKISSYTDKSGSEKQNLDLSRKRAEKLKELLVQYGYKPKVIFVQYFGEQFATSEDPKERKIVCEISFNN